jgi:hypothetical protein
LFEKRHLKWDMAGKKARTFGIAKVVENIFLKQNKINLRASRICTSEPAYWGTPIRLPQENL